MGYNCVRVGDDIIRKKKSDVIHNLGELDWQIYECISENHICDEVIITDEQVKHIRERHYLKRIIDDPDYIFKDKQPNTGLIVKKIENAKESALLVLKILTVNDRKDYKNSVITGWKITERRLNNYLRNKEIIYRKE